MQQSTIINQPKEYKRDLYFTDDHELIELFRDDLRFDKLYPKNIQAKSVRHWTPLNVARTAAEFLAPHNNVHVLDIGSGVGKFCLAAAKHKPNAVFYGVEQRKDLVDNALDVSSKSGIYNVSFIHGNFTQLDFRQFDHFYFFNSFYENLKGTEKIDYKIEHSLSLYNYYNRYLFKQLEQKPTGTRIATYHSLEDEIPPCYYVVKTEFNGLLKFWVKV
jgi:SAM-dependent methyltransferase